jgi:hypothetical protein
MRTSVRAAVICIILLIAVLAVNLFIFSQWHRHGSSLAKQPCNFSTFDHGNGVEASCAIPIEPPATPAWFVSAHDPVLRTFEILVPCAGRAPPA